MPSDRSPEFEPSLEASSIERPLRPRLRDRTGADLPKLTWPPTERPAEQESSEQAPVEQEAVEQEPNEQTQPAPLPPEPAAGSTAGESVLDSSSASSDAAPVDLETPAPDQERHVGAEPSVASVVGEPMLDDEYGVPLLPERPPRPVEVTPEPGAGDTERLPEPETSDSPSTHAGRVGNRWFRVRRRIVGAAAIAVVLGLTYFLITLAQVWLTGRTDDDGPVDAIVVMGAAQYDGRPSPQLAARLDHVVELWPTGVAPLVVVTGGNIPGDRFTEAEASAAYLVERGVPEAALVLENSGSNTYESLDAVAMLLEARGVDEVLIVTDPYHALRSRLVAEEVGLDASVSSTDTSVVTGGESLVRHLKEAGGVSVGRIIGFERLTRLVD